MADVASLAVALHLNAASFKSDVADAYNSAAASSHKFTQTVGTDSAKTAQQLSQVSNEAKLTGNSIARMGSQSAQTRTGFTQLRTSLNNISAGANVAGTSLISSFIPALERAANDVDRLAMSLDEKRLLDVSAANDAIKLAESQLQEAASAKESAKEQMKLGHKMREAAVYRREHAKMLDDYMDKQLEVSRAHGLNITQLEKIYAEDRKKNAREIKEANSLETKAKKKIEAGAESLAAAEAKEIATKKGLTAATQQLAVANQELSFAQRTSMQAGNLLKNTWAMLGGTLGVALMATAGAATYLYTQYKQAEERQKAFYAAMQKGGAGFTTSISEMKRLAEQLGGTADAYKSVTSAIGAGFSGELLRSVSELGVQLEKSGGSVDLLVSKLSAINEQPLQGLKTFISEGAILDANIIARVAKLEREEKIEEAKELARESATKATKELHEKQTKANEAHAESLKKLNEGYLNLLFSIDAYDENAGKKSLAALKQFQTNKAAFDAETKKNEEEQQQAQKGLTKNLLDQLTLEGKLNAAILAGKDRSAEKVKLENEFNSRLKAGAISLEQHKEGMKGLEFMYANTSTFASTTVNEGRKRLDQLREQEAVLRQQLATNEKQTSASNKLAAFDAEILSLQGKKLDASQKNLLAHSAEIRSQLQINAELERELQYRELKVKFDAQNFEMAQKTLQMQRDAKNELLKRTMGTADYDLMLEEQRIEDDFRQRRYQLDKEVSDKTSQLYIEQTAVLAQEKQKQVEIARQSSADQKKADENWQDGLKKGWTDFSEGAGNSFDLMRNVSANAMNSTSTLFSDFLTTGKMGFADFTKSVLSDITKMIVQMTLFNALKTGLTGTWLGNAMGMTPNATGGVYTSPGLSSYSNSIVNSPTFFPFAKGGAPNMGLMGEAGSEAIMPLKRGPDGNLGVRAYGSGESRGGVYMPINIGDIHFEKENNQGSGTNIDTSGIRQQLKTAVVDTIGEQVNRPGTPLWNAIYGRR